MVVIAAPTAVPAGLIGPAPGDGRVREVPLPGRESRVRGHAGRGPVMPVGRAAVLRVHGAPGRRASASIAAHGA